MTNIIYKVAFGGGCFWCTEVIFLNLKGVISVTPGYAGGSVMNPTYEQVGGGKTGHAEVILIEYNETIIKFEELLQVFFDSHDPTTINRQGNDVGSQYRSIILYANDQQKSESFDFINKLYKSKYFLKKLVTEVAPLTVFYPSEEYHTNYYNNHPNESYSKMIIKPKIDNIKTKYSNLQKEND